MTARQASNSVIMLTSSFPPACGIGSFVLRSVCLYSGHIDDAEKSAVWDIRNGQRSNPTYLLLYVALALSCIQLTSPSSLLFVQVTMTVGLGCAAAADVIIMLTTAYHTRVAMRKYVWSIPIEVGRALTRVFRRGKHPPGNQADTFLAYSVNTGAITAIFSILSVVLVSTLPLTYHCHARLRMSFGSS